MKHELKNDFSYRINLKQRHKFSNHWERRDQSYCMSLLFKFITDIEDNANPELEFFLS